MDERGAATIEYLALSALMGLVAIAAIAALLNGPSNDGGRLLGGAIARRIACAPRLPAPCRRDPLVEAYGRPLAGAVRALAPAPTARPGAGGVPLAPVDFRRCRRPSCAVAAGPRLTTAGRRTTAFTAVFDRRRSGGDVALDYWLYRPGLGWERVERSLAGTEVGAYAGVPLLDSQYPALVPLETLPGRNHYDFPPAEEPPWRWRLPSIYPG
jgi:hypothetical protein